MAAFDTLVRRIKAQVKKQKEHQGKGRRWPWMQLALQSTLAARARQVKDGAQGGQLAGGRERSWEEEAEY